MEMLALIIGGLVVVWYFGMIRSVRKVATAADFKAAELQMAAHSSFKAKYSRDDVQAMKEDLELLNSF